jgi:dGTPase
MDLGPSSIMASEKQELSQFMFENVYRHEQLIAIREQAALRVKRLHAKLVAKTGLLPGRFLCRADEVGIERAAGYYIAGMTDRFCDARFHELVELGATEIRDW